VLHGHCWTLNRLHRHGLRHTYDYAICAQDVETLDHLLVGCVYSRKTWFMILRYFGLQDLAPQMELLCFMKLFACIRPRGVALFQGELACVQGELFVVFELGFRGFCSFLTHGFVSDVSSRFPCLSGWRLVFFKLSCSLPFPCLSITS
jgi:hypothetical protein